MVATNSSMRDAPAAPMRPAASGSRAMMTQGCPHPQRVVDIRCRDHRRWRMVWAEAGCARELRFEMAGPGQSPASPQPRPKRAAPPMSLASSLVLVGTPHVVAHVGTLPSRRQNSWYPSACVRNQVQAPAKSASSWLTSSVSGRENHGRMNILARIR